MRKYFSIILGSLLLSLVACSGSDDAFDPISNDPDYVVLSAKVLGVTRSEDTEAESTLAHIDVYVMDANYNVFHSERIKAAAPVAGQGQFVMKKKRQEFTEGAGYYVYMIANSKETTHPAARTWDDLLELTQEDENMHLTGMYHGQDLDNVPTYFLMDGFAYLSTDASGKTAKTMSPIVINDGNPKNKIELSGTLYRAAAKFVLNITQGDDVEFKQILDNATPALSFYQLPISTLVVTPEADARYTSTKQNTKEWGVDTNFVWVTDKDGKPNITIVGYAYANDWSKEQSINETAMLLSIPMMWDKNGLKGDGKEAASPVNWYKIPLSKESKFERNKCYVINVKINAIGAEGKNVPIELKDIEYQTLDWQDVKLTIGDYGARYLTLNTDLVKIYDKNFDLDQLTFASSSPIKSIKLKDVFSHNERKGNVYSAFTALEVTKESEDGSTEAEYEQGDGVYAYYIDKFGQKIQLGTDPNFALKDVDHSEWTKEDILAHEMNLYNKVDENGNPLAPADQYIHANVREGQERALNGNIHIYSPMYADASNDDLNWNSHFNTVRYLEFEVMNEQGLTATFRVEQRPTIIITNEEGYFSYRSDQKYDDNQPEASHFHNYMGWKSYHATGYMWYYEYDWTDTGYDDNEEDLCLDTDVQRNYSKAVKVTKGDGICDVLHYGSIYAPHKFIDNRGVEVTMNYSGLQRSVFAPTGSFLRHRYYKFSGVSTTGVYSKGGYKISSKYYDYPRGDIQGAAIGPIYEVEVDGEIRKYRKMYTWNLQVIFYNRYVSKVWKENGTDDNGRTKLRGQADINSMTHAQTTYYGGSATGWASWGLQSYSNHRMYHINTSNTSQDYTIGYPSLREDGIPHNTPDNAKLVSPGLMMASQLGATDYQSILNTIAAGNAKNPGSYPYEVPVVGNFYKLAQQHCQEYVETTFIDKPDENGVYNGVWDEGEEVIHYDDWRLPTKAEIDRIIEFQESSRAMDKLLECQYYFCITGKGENADINDKNNWVSVEVPNYTASKTGYYIRCVRDAGRKTK